jgi:hypothetical protein
VLVLGVFGAVPAFAQEMTECDHTTIQSLADCVAHAEEMGHISNPAVALSLLAKVDAAQTAYDGGRTAVAVRLLNAFIYEVKAQAGVTIDAMHAEHMIMHAEAIQAALG